MHLIMSGMYDTREASEVVCTIGKSGDMAHVGCLIPSVPVHVPVIDTKYGCINIACISQVSAGYKCQQVS